MESNPNNVLTYFVSARSVTAYFSFKTDSCSCLECFTLTVVSCRFSQCITVAHQVVGSCSTHFSFKKQRFFMLQALAELQNGFRDGLFKSIKLYANIIIINMLKLVLKRWMRLVCHFRKGLNKLQNNADMYTVSCNFKFLNTNSFANIVGSHRHGHWDEMSWVSLVSNA